MSILAALPNRLGDLLLHIHNFAEFSECPTTPDYVLSFLDDVVDDPRLFVYFVEGCEGPERFAGEGRVLRAELLRWYEGDRTNGSDYIGSAPMKRLALRALISGDLVDAREAYVACTYQAACDRHYEVASCLYPVDVAHLRYLARGPKPYTPPKEEDLQAVYDCVKKGPVDFEAIKAACPGTGDDAIREVLRVLADVGGIVCRHGQYARPRSDAEIQAEQLAP